MVGDDNLSADANQKAFVIILQVMEAVEALN